ncbi:MAG: glycine-rich protein [Bacteroidota bacterium]
MKRHSKVIFLFFTVLLLSQFSAKAQGTAINNTGSSADPSALLDVSSTNKGVLIPRMSESERNAIVNPAEGLLIFNTSSKCFNTFIYGAWFELCGKCVTPPGTSDFTISKDSVEAGEGVNFSATNLTGDYYFWTFAGANPGYYVGTAPYGIRFNSPPGWKYMWLTVTKNGCTSTTRDSVYVKPIYNNTQTQQIFIVPPTISVVHIEAWGGSGGGNGGGGKGGHVRGDLAVNPGDTLFVFVGGSGSGFIGAGYNGGGQGNGGGASDVRYGGNALSNRIIVAGGGGGGGYATGIAGGDAGGLTGQNGMDYGSQIKGTGGSQSAGGIGGWGSGYSGQGGPGSDGTLGNGGNWGCVGGSWAGAGGGGYYGGGSGGCGDHNSWGGSGGGGSSYIGGVTNGVMYSSTNVGDGKVVITY